MANNFKTPGVYVQEISKLPPSIAAVETAIPAFIGYTEKVELGGKLLDPHANDVDILPIKIRSLNEFVEVYGGPFDEEFGPTATKIEITALLDGTYQITDGLTDPQKPSFWLYYSLQLFFANGGGECYIVSIGKYSDVAAGPDKSKMLQGLNSLEQEDEPTMLLCPDALDLGESDYYEVCTSLLAQCGKLQDRVSIFDIYEGYLDFTEPGGPNYIDGDGTDDGATGFRTGIGTRELKYGAVYYPWLQSSLTYAFDESKVNVTLQIEGGSSADLILNNFAKDNETNAAAPQPDASLFHVNNGAHRKILDEIAKFKVPIPPSGIMAGIYTQIDNTRGVWKAPANVGVTGVIKPLVKIDDKIQRDLNVHSTGKSVNAIRSFKGKGNLVWGARTLDGNSNEWRYVPVRRFFNFAEESIRKGTEPFVFEPNDRNTWTRVRGMIENFLTLQWNAGALQGATPEDAFFVKVGLPETMTALDILEGRMNVEIGMAVVRPAEFIILKFSHKLPES